MRVQQRRQRIPQERRQHGAGVFQLLAVAGLLQHGAQIQLALVVDVLLGPVAKAQGVLLDRAQRGARRLDFGDAGGHAAHQRGVQFLAARDGLHVVGQIEQRAHRKNPLRFQDADHILHELGVGFGVGRFRSAGQQIHQAVLRVGARRAAVAAIRVFTPARPASNNSRVPWMAANGARIAANVRSACSAGRLRCRQKTCQSPTSACMVPAVSARSNGSRMRPTASAASRYARMVLSATLGHR